MPRPQAQQQLQQPQQPQQPQLPAQGQQQEGDRGSPQTRAKRQFAQFQGKIRSRTHPKKKQKKKSLSRSLLESCESYARWMSRNIGMFLNMQYMFDVGLVAEGIFEEVEHQSDEEEEEAEETRSERERSKAFHVKAFTTLLAAISELRDALIAMTDEELDTLISVMHKAYLQAQGNNRSKMSKAIMKLIVNNPTFKPHIALSKSNRGFKSLETARLLVPISHLGELETRGMVFINELQAGNPPATAQQWPAYLFGPGHIYNPEDPDAGVCQSPALIRICFHLRLYATDPSLQGWKHLFQGNGINDPDRCESNKTNVAGINELTEVTGESIAYAAVQFRFALSDKGAWSPNDALFHHLTFYHAILELFSEPEDPFVIETLKFWNDTISLISNTAPAAGPATLQPVEAGSNRERSRATRICRLTALAATAQQQLDTPPQSSND